MDDVAREAFSDSNDGLRQAVVEQLQKLEHDADLTSASDFRIAQNWEKINNYLGMAIVVVSGIVTVIGAAASMKELENLQPHFTMASTILASVATAIGSVLTFLKPSERGGRYREFGNKQKTLRNRIRIYRTVQILRDTSFDGPPDQLIAFATEKDALNSDNPPIPRSAFAVAVRDLQDKAMRRAKLEAVKNPLVS